MSCCIWNQNANEHILAISPCEDVRRKQSNLQQVRGESSSAHDGGIAHSCLQSRLILNASIAEYPKKHQDHPNAFALVCFGILPSQHTHKAKQYIYWKSCEVNPSLIFAQSQHSSLHSQNLIHVCVHRTALASHAL